MNKFELAVEIINSLAARIKELEAQRAERAEELATIASAAVRRIRALEARLAHIHTWAEYHFATEDLA